MPEPTPEQEAANEAKVAAQPTPPVEPEQPTVVVESPPTVGQSEEIQVPEEDRLREPLRQRTQDNEDQVPVSTTEVVETEEGSKVVTTTHNPGTPVVDPEDDESTADQETEAAELRESAEHEEVVAKPVDSIDAEATYDSKPNIVRP